MSLFGTLFYGYCIILTYVILLSECFNQTLKLYLFLVYCVNIDVAKPAPAEVGGGIGPPWNFQDQVISPTFVTLNIEIWEFSWFFSTLPPLRLTPCAGAVKTKMKNFCVFFFIFNKDSSHFTFPLAFFTVLNDALQPGRLGCNKIYRPRPEY